MTEIGLQEYLPSNQKDYLPHLLLPPPIQPSCAPDLQVKTENMSPLYTANNNHLLTKQGKEQVEEEEVISQFFEELEGQYPHLRGELGQEMELGRMLNSDTDSSSSLSELGKVLSDTDSSSLCSSSPRHSATPVDTIPASNLTHPRYQAPISTDAVPVIHITPLPNQLNPTTESGSNLTYQDDLNNFCEGILSQLGTSAWAEELNLGPDLGDPTTSTSSGQEVVYRTISLPTHSAIQQQQQSPLSTFSHQSKLVHQTPLSNFPVPSACPWMMDKANLPTGWRTRMVDVMVGSRKIKRAEFLSPNGQHFPSRKTAVDHMIRTAAYSNEDLECMKRGLRTKTQFEWESGRPGVPEGWMTREKLSSDGKVRVFYLSPGGISFPCRQAALDHMAADGKYSQEAVEMMRIGIGVKRSRGQGEFVLGDTSLPPGWKVRQGAGGRETFRCPRGVFHPSRTAVLETLEREGAPKNQLELVRQSLGPARKRRKRRVGEDDWVERDPSLPANWKIRLVDCSDGHAVTFLQTPQGVKLKGRRAGLAHVLKNPGLFSQEDADLMRDSLNIVSKVTEAWEDNDPSLPPGWRIKRYKSKTETKRVHCEFLSPGMRVFRSRRAVADHLKEQGAPKEQISRLEAGSSSRPETVVSSATSVVASRLTANSVVGPSSSESTREQARVTMSSAVKPEQAFATRTLPFPNPSPQSQSLSGTTNMPLSSSTSLPHSSISSPIWRSTILPPSTDPPLWSTPTLVSTNSQSFLPGRPVGQEGLRVGGDQGGSRPQRWVRAWRQDRAPPDWA